MVEKMGKGGKNKTNAMRYLDAADITYEIIDYDVSDGKIDGVSVALKVGHSVEKVYKTLVTQSASKQNYVFCIPVQEELHLKKAALAVGEKKVEMIPVKDIQKTTGYLKGGCSPIGMKKKFPTYLAEQAINQKLILVSGGQIGKQIEIRIEDLIKVTEAKIADLIQ